MSSQKKGSALVPDTPAPPKEGKKNHHSIELQWTEALDAAKKKSKSRVRAICQEQDRSGIWQTIYVGYAKKHIVDSLEPNTQYHYRLKFKNEEGESDCSDVVIYSTEKEPINGEHIHKAIVMGNLKQLETVLQSGDSMRNLIDTADKYGMSPLMAAAKKKEKSRDMIEILVKYHADVNFRNKAGKTALMIGAFEGNKEACKALMDANAEMELQDRAGCTALHWSIDGGNLNLIETLLDRGANILARDSNGWTPLLRAASLGGKKDIAEILLRHNKINPKQEPIIDIRDNNGKTALMIAVVNGHQAFIAKLLEWGADITLTNEYDKSAYEMAISMERRQVTNELEKHMEKNNIKRRF